MLCSTRNCKGEVGIFRTNTYNPASGFTLPGCRLLIRKPREAGKGEVGMNIYFGVFREVETDAWKHLCGV